MLKNKIKCYCAWPDVFLDITEYEQLMEEQKKIAKEISKKYCINIELIFPIDTSVDATQFSDFEAASMIRLMNENKIKDSDVVLANVEYFRGVDTDSGTAYEIGFSRALGKPVFLYTNEDTMIEEYSKHEPFKEKHINVENFGLPYNLMLFDISKMHSKTFEESLNKSIEDILK